MLWNYYNTPSFWLRWPRKKGVNEWRAQSTTNTRWRAAFSDGENFSFFFTELISAGTVEQINDKHSTRVFFMRLVFRSCRSEIGKFLSSITRARDGCNLSFSVTLLALMYFDLCQHAQRSGVKWKILNFSLLVVMMMMMMMCALFLCVDKLRWDSSRSKMTNLKQTETLISFCKLSESLHKKILLTFHPFVHQTHFLYVC